MRLLKRYDPKNSIQKHGWLPGLFRKIVDRAKNIVQVLIRKAEIPPQLVLNLDLEEFRTMQKLEIDRRQKKNILLIKVGNFYYDYLLLRNRES